MIAMEKFHNLAARGAAVGGTLVGLLGLGVLLAGPSSAQAGDPGTAAINDFGDKVTTYGTAMIGVVVIAVGLMLAVKYIRKAASKA